MLLIRTLTARIRTMAARVSDPAGGRRQTEALCRRAREIAAEARAAPPGEAATVFRRLIAAWTDRPD
jgi:hypothetical protein